MAQTSLGWATNGTGDGAAPYTQAQFIDWIRRTYASDNYAAQGVLVGYEGELEVTEAAPNVNVAAGAAVVYGFPYESTAVESVNIPTPLANTRVDRIVLRASWAAQTVRITRIAGVEGAGAPALVQTPGTTYDIPLAEVSITTGGVITVVDQRAYCHFATRVATENLDDLAVTPGKIGANAVIAGKLADGAVETTARLANDIVDDTKVGNRVPQVIRRQGGDAADWSLPGGNNYTPTMVVIQSGNMSTTILGGFSAASDTVTFPVAFSQPPHVIAGLSSNMGEAIDVAVIAVTAVNATIQFRRAGTTGDLTVTARWLAIGPE